ncbi:MAG TPA: MFS transporter [Actinomycetota bacterium]|nr:MFS transporter [Actinomycetota bacterium]
MSPRVTAVLGRTFSSVRSSRNFRLYLTGNTVSAIGTWMNFTASAWLVLTLTESGTALGANIALYFLPVLLLGAYGGVLADRFDKRHILMITQAAYGVVALALWALVAGDLVELWMVYALSVASGIVTAIDNPSRQSFYVEMVGEEHVRNAVSMNSAAFTGSRVIGPAIAGLLIHTVGIAACFLIDGISYAAVLVALWAMRPAELHAQKRSTRLRGHLGAGLRYVWTTDALRRPLIVMAVVFTVSFNFAVFVPLLAKETFGGDAGTFGALSALAGVGSFLGAIVMASREPAPDMRGLSLWSIATGVSLVLSGLAPTLVLAGAAMIPMGFTIMAFMITGNTMLQLTSRPEARGRVMALYGIVFLGSTPIGAPIAGVIGEHLGPRIGFVMSGAVAAGLGLALLGARLRRARVPALAEQR